MPLFYTVIPLINLLCANIYNGTPFRYLLSSKRVLILISLKTDNIIQVYIC